MSNKMCNCVEDVRTSLDVVELSKMIKYKMIPKCMLNKIGGIKS